MSVSARDLPEARRKRYAYHAAAGLVALLASWNALSWNARAREAASVLAAAQEKVSAGRLAADGVAAECGLPPFSDEKSLRRFPMHRPPFPTKRESACLQKVTEVRGSLINDLFDLDRAAPIAAETSATARRRLAVAGVFAAIFLAGVYAMEIHQGRRASPRRVRT